MLLLNADDDPIVPTQLHYIPRQFARMSLIHLFYSLPYSSNSIQYKVGENMDWFWNFVLPVYDDIER